MNARLEDIIATLRRGVSLGKEADLIGVLSTGERCFVALSIRRLDLLPVAYANPIEAWHRLDSDWQRGVCRHNDWPESWASTTRLEIAVDLHRLRVALDAAGIPASTLQGVDATAERLQYLIEERDGLLMEVESTQAGSRPMRSASNR